ncbi:MBL fold metallo-hydrolase [Dehalococcoidales bacterium]|nr:MBL fold metallo-hydrolase [Dehalococcoidales bacterium]
MVDISEIAENIYLIDDYLYSIPRYGCVYLINEEKKALIDTGPTTSVSAVLDGIKRVGVRPEDIAYIIVTHIHLDHAGGAGVLAKDMPHAQVLVHHKGARHLVNPAKLISSVIEVQGEEAMVKHGEVLPIELHRVQAMHEGDTIKLSEKQTLKFIDAPGHAPHELCIYETRTGGLFTGDAVGVSIAENEILLPFHPPPNFDLPLCLNTLERLAKLAPTSIYYSHFGVSNTVPEDLRLAREKLQVWDDIIAKAIKEGAFADTTRRLIVQACAELELIKGVESLESLYKYITNHYIPMCAAGHVKYYQEKYEAELDKRRK